jgi:photosystem II stability/assembly factor-like uncharacterized protein
VIMRCMFRGRIPGFAFLAAMSLLLILSSAGGLTGCSTGSSDSGFGAAGEGGTLIDLGHLRSGIWQAQGPGVAEVGQVTIPAQDNPDVGAIRVVAPHPSDQDVLFIGAVNGGIWRTGNATAPGGPLWVPLTDDQSSLSIGDLQFDPADASSQTLIAGTGHFSAFRRTQADPSGLLPGLGGPLVGLLRTTDGGGTWKPLGREALSGRNIASLAVRGPVILVAANQAGASPGLYRSIDGGITFSWLSDAPASRLPAGPVQAVTADRAKPGRFYAAVSSAGIFRSDDDGATWSDVTTPTLAQVFDANTDNVKIAIHNSPGTTVVWVGVVQNGSAAGFFRSADEGASWTELGVPTTVDNGITIGLITETTNGSGLVHFGMGADPKDPNLLYAGGDAQPSGDGNVLAIPTWPNSTGSVNYTGRLFRADASHSAGSIWTPLTDNFALTPEGQPTGPHADSRCIAFDPAGNLIETDDGGIYRRSLPASPQGSWSSLIGTGSLMVTEFHSVALDTVSQTILGGTQDIGVPEQLLFGGPLWRSAHQDDGGNVAVDASKSDFSIRYSSTQYLIDLDRRFVTPDNVVVKREIPTLIVEGSGGMSLSSTYDPSLQFYSPLTLNSVDPSRLLIGSTILYESFDRGDHLKILGPLGAACGGSTYGDPLIYGGMRGGRANADLIYAGAGSSLFLRTSAGGVLTRMGAYPGSDIAAIAIHPSDWSQAIVLDLAHVYVTGDAGQTWSDITGDLPLTELQTVTFIPATKGPSAILVGGVGGVYATLTDSPGSWQRVGAGLPMAVAMDMHYDPERDILLLGTLGRGAWTLGGLLSTSGQ